ncbi:DNA polymerase III subunit beta family protein [Gordonia sp. KTR9]|uniref:DNA polymerase III subunit beta family protein n=1 Tax=Gordonia sp. KTR9 TaxID=337191 RepID=UPI0002DD6604|nr:MerR family transcriptional regulator [Gordonia sp. KTR9]
MSDPRLMSIGEFAKLAELTTSALRFYDDAGLLRPELVDPLTGYRLYSDAQLEPALQLRRLREVGMPLSAIGTFFTAGDDEKARLIDDQIARVAADTVGMYQVAAALKASLGEGAHITVCELSGPVLAAAVDQVLATTVHDRHIPVLGGVRMETDLDSVSLTATDRYRLATRTLFPDKPFAGSWAGTLAGEDLQGAISRLRRSPRVIAEAGERTLTFRMVDGTVAHCRLLTETFPDYKMLIRSLALVTHRVTIDNQQILTALEQTAPDTVGLEVIDSKPVLLLPDARIDLNGSATGPDLTLWFELTTLYPALGHTVGNDVMLDLRGPDQPATVRSADAGDLTVLVMPCRHPSSITG